MPQTPIHRPIPRRAQSSAADSGLLLGWGHETPSRADLKAGLCMLLCLKHSKGAAQFEVSFGLPCSGACPLLLMASLQHRDTQDPTTAGGRRTSQTGSVQGRRCRLASHHRHYLLPCLTDRHGRPQGGRTHHVSPPPNLQDHEGAGKAASLPWRCTLTVGRWSGQEWSKGSDGAQTSPAAGLLPAPRKSAFRHHYPPCLPQPAWAAVQAADTQYGAAGCRPPRDSPSSPTGEGRSKAELFT